MFTYECLLMNKNSPTLNFFKPTDFKKYRNKAMINRGINFIVENTVNESNRYVDNIIKQIKYLNLC